MVNPLNWNKVLLGDIVDFFDHQRIPLSSRERQKRQGPYPYYGASGIIDYLDDYIFDGKYLLVAEDGENLNSRKTPVAFFATGKFWVNNHAHIIRAVHGKADDYFIKAWFDQANISGYITGAAQPKLSQANLKRIQVHLPPLPTQRKIAAILSAYDDLIENNTRRINILEEMAQTLYRHWFVDYKFPGHENVRLVDSGTEMGLVPEGWEVVTLENILATIESGSRPRGGIDPSESEVPSIGAENILGLGQYDYTKEKYVSQEFFSRMNRGKIQHGDVLLYKDGASLGRKSLFRDNFPHQVCCINEHVFILRCNERCTQSYLYFWLDQPNMTQAIVNLNTNAAQPGISQSKVISLPILIPDKKSLHLWEEISEPLLALLFSLAKKNTILRKTRDLLLPKLISGDLDVSEMEISGSQQYENY